MKQAVNRGFTLIELVIVIAILGIVASGIVIAINPLGKLNSANLAKVKTFSASTENALIISQIGKWSFEEVVNNETPDTSGYGNNGTVNGATWQTKDQCGLGFGRCLSFDGNGDYVDLGVTNKFLHGARELTISAWVKPNMIGRNSTIFTSNISFGSEYFAVTIFENNKIYSYISPDGGGGNTRMWQTKNSVIKKGIFQHIIIAWDGTDNPFKMYYNAEKQEVEPSPWGSGPGTIANKPIDQSDLEASGNQWIGAYAPDRNYFDGLIDQVSIYKKALTAYQIRELYAQGLAKHQLAME